MDGIRGAALIRVRLKGEARGVDVKRNKSYQKWMTVEDLIV